MRPLTPKNLAAKRAAVDKLIEEKRYEEALDIASSHIINDKPSIQYTITKGRLLSEYRIKEDELSQLSCIMMTNPHYNKAPSMYVYLVAEVRAKFKLKPKWEKYYQSLGIVF